jgi:hypothetical protein
MVLDPRNTSMTNAGLRHKLTKFYITQLNHTRIVDQTTGPANANPLIPTAQEIGLFKMNQGELHK